ncbi:uncharacterized protein LOC119355646 isoform X3 [Triticum dicoccoides]|nr:uncharacterized protein LOC119355646 isoform X3 [Triticum dicoccoides]
MKAFFFIQSFFCFLHLSPLRHQNPHTSSEAPTEPTMELLCPSSWPTAMVAPSLSPSQMAPYSSGLTVAPRRRFKEEEFRMMVVSSSEIKEEEVRLTVGASRAGKSSSPAGGAEEVRKTAKKVEEVVWNAVFALLARRFSLSGLTTPSASVIEESRSIKVQSFPYRNRDFKEREEKHGHT